MSVILGLNMFHADSSACIVVDGQLKAAVAEERLGRRWKHDASFPEHAIQKVISDAGLTIKEVTHVAIARNSRANMGAKAKYAFKQPLRSIGAIREHLSRQKKELNLAERLANIFGVSISQIHPTIVNVEHHLAHIASAYYCSPFDSASALSYDGSGDFVSLMAARCEGTKINILDKVYLPDSIGFFYTALCQFIGFDYFGEEYKVMGLAPYGEDRYREEMAKLIITKPGGWFQLGQGYFGMHSGGASDEMDENGNIVMGKFYKTKLTDLIGTPRNRKDPLTQREKDIARSCQVRFEEVAVHCLKHLYQLAPNKNLCMAGGCALNGVANAKILKDTLFKIPYLQAASSDEGTSLGAAMWCYHNVVGGGNRYIMKHAFLGPEYSEAEIRNAIKKFNCKYEEMEDSILFKKIVALLRRGAVVGWYQGRSEWGPRALGNRSILADPTNPNMKSIINTKIKRRESFRPFAPSVLAEKVKDYFEQDVSSPFMMHVVKFKPEWRGKLPAVTHVDGTGRLQSVTREENPRYYDLIKCFSEVSGVGILLNTSFNENEPVVDTPEQALNCFLRTDMDALCLENMLILKEETLGSHDNS